MSWLSGLFGGNSKVNAPPTPDYFTDPNFSGTQDFLKNYAEQGLQGNMPDWYKQIGEMMPDDIINGKTNSINSSILGADAERSALRGTGRGGALSADTMGAIGNADASTRYSEWVRAMQGRSGLMDSFTNMENGVRSAGYANQGAKNQFDWTKYGADLTQEQNRAKQANSISTRAMGMFTGQNTIDQILGMFGGGNGATSSAANPDYSYLNDLSTDFTNPDTGDSSLNFGRTSTGASSGNSGSGGGGLSGILSLIMSIL